MNTMQHESSQISEKKDRHWDGLLKGEATAASVYLLWQRLLQAIQDLTLQSSGFSGCLLAQCRHYALWQS